MLHSPARRARAAALFAGLATLCVLSPLSAEPAGTIYQRAVATAARSDKDRERDARDRPAEVLAFAGFKPGMRIADLFGGGGYYSELLSYVVGPRGEVVLVNNPPYARFAAEDLAIRFRDGRLAAITRRIVPSEDMGLGHERLDAALMVMSYHDLYYAEGDDFPAIDAGQFLDQVRDALKPGGLLLIVDHAAAPGTGRTLAQTLHRIDESFAEADLKAHGFELLKRFDGLRNAGDDRSKLVFDPAIRGHTDRFVHLYRRR